MLLALLMACRVGDISPGTRMQPDEEVPDEDTSAEEVPDEETEDFDSICPSAGGRADELALWTASEGSLSFLRLDGGVVEGHRFFEGIEGGNPGWPVVRAEGDWILAVAGLYVPDPAGARMLTELVLLDRQGTVHWTWQEEGVYSTDAFLGEDGTVAWDRGWESFDASEEHLSGRVFLPDGTRAMLDGWPVGNPIEGRVPRCDGATCSWDDPSTGSAEGMRDEAATPWWRSVAGWLVHPQGEPAVLVLERPDERLLLELPGAPAAADIRVSAVAGGWMLLYAPGGEAWRVDVENADATRLEPSPPEGLRRFEDAEYCSALPPTIDDRGNVLIGLRDDRQGALWALDEEGAWSQVSAEVTSVLWLTGGGLGGSYLTQAISEMETYCPGLAWDPAPAALAGSSLQLSRPADGLLWSSTEQRGWFAGLPFDPSGSCALLHEETGPVVLDLRTGEQKPLAEGTYGWVLAR